MKLELRKGAVRLGPNQTLKVVDGAGSTVSALEGAVWITEENRPQDIVLEPGIPIACASAASRSSTRSAAPPPCLLPEGTAMRFDYPNLETINARARRERAQAVYQLIIVPLARFFAGLKIDVIAAMLGISTATVKRDLTTATVWLRHRMGR